MKKRTSYYYNAVGKAFTIGLVLLFFIPNQVVSTNEESNDGCELLIITHPDFLPAALELQEWKIKKGIMTHVITTDECGSESSEIKDYIQTFYDSMDPSLGYLILLGDAEFIPSNDICDHPDTDHFVSDLYYSTLEGDDYYPDVALGRIPVDTLEEAKIIINKIIDYETTPPLNEGFYMNMTSIAFFEDQNKDDYEDWWFVYFTERIRNSSLNLGYSVERIYRAQAYLNPKQMYCYVNPQYFNQSCWGEGMPLPDELVDPEFEWDSNNEDITEAINHGTFLIDYSGHGIVNAWINAYDPAYPNFYHVDDIQQDLTNDNLLPVVLSFCCATGKFDHLTIECFCEVLLRKQGGGACAVVGSTDTSYQGYNEMMKIGFRDAIWPELDQTRGAETPIYRLGDVLNYGKWYMNDILGSQPMVPYVPHENLTKLHYELIHLFGDPTMEIRTMYPRQLFVNHPKFINDEFIATVCDEFDNPIEDAVVCLTDNSGLFICGKTNADGEIILDTSSAEPGALITVCATASNSIPYEGNVRVATSHAILISAEPLVNKILF